MSTTPEYDERRWDSHGGGRAETPGEFAARQAASRQALVDERRARVRELYQRHAMGVRAIGRTLGISHSTVLQDLAALTAPPPAEPIHAPDPLRNPNNRAGSGDSYTSYAPTTDDVGELADDFLRSLRRDPT